MSGKIAVDPAEFAKITIEKLIADGVGNLEVETTLKAVKEKTKLSLRVLREEFALQIAKAKVSAVSLEDCSPLSRTAEKLTFAFRQSKNLIRIFNGTLKLAGYIANEILSGSLLISHGCLLLPFSTGYGSYGPPSSGKSDAAEKAAVFLPPEKVIRMTQMTPKAMFYMEDLTGKYLLLGELNPAKTDEDDIRQGTIRQFLSENFLILRTVERGPDGVNRMVERIIKGPVVIAFTSVTEPHRWDSQLQSRCSWIVADSSEDTTRKVLKEVARRASSRTPKTIPKDWITAWREFHRSLKPIRVVIPYADAITPNGENPAIRRVFKQLLHYVEVLALLHQHTRTKFESDDGGEYIEADWVDYAWAYKLVRANAPRVMATISDEAQKAFRERLLPLKKKVTSITGPEIIKALGVSKTTGSRWREDFVTSGLLVFKAKDGRTNLYEFGKEDELIIPDELGLITPQEAEKRFKAEQLVQPAPVAVGAHAGVSRYAKEDVRAIFEGDEFHE